MNKFIKINNIIIPLDTIKSTYYSFSEENFIVETEKKTHSWYVPQKEGNFILNNFFKLLNNDEKEEFNFYFKKPPRNTIFFYDGFWF